MAFCGVEAIENLLEFLKPLDIEPFDIETLTSVAEDIQKEQDLFSATGVYAAMAFDRSGRSCRHP